MTDKKSLEENFKKHFERINQVSLSESEFEKLKRDIIISDVFKTS